MRSAGLSISIMKLRGGQHQALEAKEGVEISQENRSVAAVTYQNLFLLFPKMAGMSGTMADAVDELRSVYGAKVLVIPPNLPSRRVDLSDRYFRNKEEQIQAAVEETLELHAMGRPVLIVASNIVDTEAVSKGLLEEQVPHNVLNANNAAWEAQIVKEAGQYIREGHFAPGSMLPKVQAAVDFAASKEGRTALITLLEKSRDAIRGTTGTTFHL